MIVLSRRLLRIAGASLAVLTAAGMAWAGMAWACVGVVSLTTDASTVQPGGTLMVTGREFASVAPVVIHLDSLSGPVLATVAMPGSDTMTSKFTVSVAVPADIQPGQHLLIATQAAHDMNSGAPARSVFYVGAGAPTSVPVAARPIGLVVGSGRSVAGLTVIGLAAAGAGLALVGLWSLIRTQGSRSARA
jgi:hypothetical protein